MDAVSRHARETWNNVYAATSSGGGDVLLKNHLTDHFLGVIVGMTIGLNMSSDSEQLHHLHNLLRKMMGGFTSFWLDPVSGYTKARDELVQFLSSVIRESIQQHCDLITELRASDKDVERLGERGIKDGSMNVLLIAIAASDLDLKPHADLDESAFRALALSVIGLWIAGHHTVAATTKCAVQELGTRPDMQRLLAAEAYNCVRRTSTRRYLRQVQGNYRGDVPLTCVRF